MTPQTLIGQQLHNLTTDRAEREILAEFAALRATHDRIALLVQAMERLIVQARAEIKSANAYAESVSNRSNR